MNLNGMLSRHPHGYLFWSCLSGVFYHTDIQSSEPGSVYSVRIYTQITPPAGAWAVYCVWVFPHKHFLQCGPKWCALWGYPHKYLLQPCLGSVRILPHRRTLPAWDGVVNSVRISTQTPTLVWAWVVCCVRRLLHRQPLYHGPEGVCCVRISTQLLPLVYGPCGILCQNAHMDTSPVWAWGMLC